PSRPHRPPPPAAWPRASWHPARGADCLGSPWRRHGPDPGLGGLPCPLAPGLGLAPAHLPARCHASPGAAAASETVLAGPRHGFLATRPRHDPAPGLARIWPPFAPGRRVGAADYYRPARSARVTAGRCWKRRTIVVAFVGTAGVDRRYRLQC